MILQLEPGSVLGSAFVVTSLALTIFWVCDSMVTPIAALSGPVVTDTCEPRSHSCALLVSTDYGSIHCPRFPDRCSTASPACPEHGIAIRETGTCTKLPCIGNMVSVASGHS